MKAKTQFLKMYYKLPEKARTKLVYNFAISLQKADRHPMTLQVVAQEIKHNTQQVKPCTDFQDKPCLVHQPFSLFT